MAQGKSDAVLFLKRMRRKGLAGHCSDEETMVALGLSWQDLLRALDEFTCESHHELRNAFNFDQCDGSLMERRDTLAEKAGVTSRTLISREDASIEAFVQMLGRPTTQMIVVNEKSTLLELTLHGLSTKLADVCKQIEELDAKRKLLCEQQQAYLAEINARCQ